MRESVGFFSAFFGSCAGTRIFYRLRNNSWIRIIFHSILLALLCAAAVVYVRFRSLVPYVDGLKALYVQTFGNRILIAPNTVVPEKTPEKSRSVVLPLNGRLYYTGIEKQIPSQEQFALLNYALIWRPSELIVLQKAEESSGFTCFGRKFSDGALLRYPAGTPVVKFFENLPEKLPAIRNSVEPEWIETLSTSIFFAFVLGYALWILGLLWLYTFVFAGGYWIFNRNRLRFLTVRQLWKCGIYAAFPPMAVASCFPALELPFFGYETVFMIGLMIYWMVIIARLETHPELEEGSPHDERK